MCEADILLALHTFIACGKSLYRLLYVHFKRHVQENFENNFKRHPNTFDSIEVGSNITQRLYSSTCIHQAALNAVSLSVGQCPTELLAWQFPIYAMKLARCFWHSKYKCITNQSNKNSEQLLLAVQRLNDKQCETYSVSIVNICPCRTDFSTMSHSGLLGHRLVLELDRTSTCGKLKENLQKSCDTRYR